MTALPVDQIRATRDACNRVIADSEREERAVRNHIEHRNDPTDERVRRVVELAAFRGNHMTFVELGEFAHQVFGTYRVGMSPEETVRSLLAPSAVSGGGVVEGVVNAAYQRGRRSVPNNFEGCYRLVNVPNFKPMNTFSAGMAPRLTRYTKGRVAESGHFSLEGMSWQIQRSTLQFTIEQADLLDRQPIDLLMMAVEEYGVMTEQAIGDMFIRTIAANPTLSDGGALFNSTATTTAGGHANLTTAVLDTTSLDAAIVAMAGQVKRDAEGLPVHLNLVPYKLFVAAKNLPNARRLLRLMKQDDASDIQVVAETRLSKMLDPVTQNVLVGDDDSFLLVAKADEFPGIIIGGLNGKTEGVIRSFELKGGRWGMGFDITQDIGATAQQSYGLYYSTGAAA